MRGSRVNWNPSRRFWPAKSPWRFITAESSPSELRVAGQRPASRSRHARLLPPLTIHRSRHDPDSVSFQPAASVSFRRRAAWLMTPAPWRITAQPIGKSSSLTPHPSSPATDLMVVGIRSKTMVPNTTPAVSPGGQVRPGRLLRCARIASAAPRHRYSTPRRAPNAISVGVTRGGSDRRHEFGHGPLDGLSSGESQWCGDEACQTHPKWLVLRQDFADAQPRQTISQSSSVNLDFGDHTRPGVGRLNAFEELRLTPDDAHLLAGEKRVPDRLGPCM